MIIAVSACLLGENCKWSGGNNQNADVIRLLKDRAPDGTEFTVVSVCPEVMAGLPVPRPPVEIFEGRIITQDGRDLDEAYRLGAERAFQKIASAGAACAVLKERSPTCGSGTIYDGTFSHRTVPGNGVFTELLVKSGIPVYTEDSFMNLFFQGGNDHE